MSAIVTFKLLPTDKLIGLREVWPEMYHYLKEHGKEYFDDYEWSGYCIAALMAYLKAEKQIDLAESRYNLLFPDAFHSGTWFLDKPLKDKYLKQLDPKLFSSKELKAAFANWFGTGDSNLKPMTDGLRLIKMSLEMVDDHSVMIVDVG